MLVGAGPTFYCQKMWTMRCVGTNRLSQLGITAIFRFLISGQDSTKTRRVGTELVILLVLQTL